MKPFTMNIEEETKLNHFYRKVIFTGEKMQLVLMSLKAKEDIPEEIHNGIDQFIRIESGQATAYVGDEVFHLNDDDIIIIPSGVKHRIVNTSTHSHLKLYSIYAQPEHKDGTIHKTKAEADASDHEN